MSAHTRLLYTHVETSLSTTQAKRQRVRRFHSRHVKRAVLYGRLQLRDQTCSRWQVRLTGTERYLERYGWRAHEAGLSLPSRILSSCLWLCMN